MIISRWKCKFSPTKSPSHPLLDLFYTIYIEAWYWIWYLAQRQVTACTHQNGTLILISHACMPASCNLSSFPPILHNLFNYQTIPLIISSSAILWILSHNAHQLYTWARNQKPTSTQFSVTLSKTWWAEYGQACDAGVREICLGWKYRFLSKFKL